MYFILTFGIFLTFICIIFFQTLAIFVFSGDMLFHLMD